MWSEKGDAYEIENLIRENGWNSTYSIREKMIGWSWRFHHEDHKWSPIFTKRITKLEIVKRRVRVLENRFFER